MTAAPEISKPASLAGVPNADSSSPRAVWSAAGSIVTSSSPFSSGVKTMDAAIAATGTSADVAPSWLTTATGAETAGRTVSSRTRSASARSTRTGVISTGSSIGVSGS